MLTLHSLWVSLDSHVLWVHQNSKSGIANSIREWHGRNGEHNVVLIFCTHLRARIFCQNPLAKYKFKIKTMKNFKAVSAEH